MKKEIIWVVIGIVVIGGIFLLKAKEKSEGPMEATEQSAQEKPADAMPMKVVTPPDMTDAQKAQATTAESAAAGSAVTFDVNGGNFYFVPTVMKVKKGDTVTINFKNDGGFHDFIIDEFNAKTDRIKDGAIATVTFVADKAGSFEYYCSVGSHRANGMKGMLIVE